LKTILLVEDSRFMRLVNERALTRAGYSVRTACDGEEALRSAFEQPPDLVLLDMLLPKLGGPHVIQALKKSDLTAKIPIVVISSLPKTNEARLKKEGAVAYFDKEALKIHENPDALVQAVKSILGDVPSVLKVSLAADTNVSHSSKGEA
jgi:CheY-like chemotaxis protein